jgi:hypothetical protein
MYELSTQELMVFVVLGFAAGIFTSFYLTRLFEVVHMWRLFQDVLARLLMMCAKIVEDIAFLGEVKKKHMRNADFTPQQIRHFEEVDERTLTNWQDSVILSLVNRAPPSFRGMMPFRSWDDAMKFLNEALKQEK